jgi:eukaryotic-like serine/threonine-protein kinase
MRVLGVGGMGAVYQAWDAELGVPVAVKVIRPEIAEDPIAAEEIERRFKRELLLARQVTHPNIIRIHDLGDIDGIKYITMPFIDGSDLATVLKEEKKLPVPRAMRIARGTVSGLVSAHDADVIHRDLKPANIMIGPDDVPTIMDFGIARSAGGTVQGSSAAKIGIRPADLSRTSAAAASSTVAGAIVGTVAYMAPEQARGEDVDQRADIYAFGLIMYDMLIGGRRGERAVSAIAELQERMQSAPPPPRSIDPEIPEAVDAIIRRCLEPDRTKRFETTLELQQALDRLDDNGKPLPVIRRLTRRALISAAAVVLLLLGGTFYAAQWFTAPPQEHDPISVVIADLQNNTNDPSFDHTLERMLSRVLEGAGFINAFDRNRVSVLGAAAPDVFDETAARELAVKQGLAVVLAGSIDRRGSGYEISVRATETLTGNVIGTARSRASSKDEVLETATKMMASIRRALGEKTSSSAQLFAMRSVSASSLDVVSHYAAAIEAQSRGKFEDARDSYLKAVELDPKFGLGYQGLAVVSRNLGRPEDAEKYIKEALRYLDSMTDRERFGTRGFYYRMIGDNQQCATEYGELLALYPADTVGHIQRGVCLAAAKNMREAMNEFRQAVQMLPNHVGYRTNLALVSSLAGDFEAAESEVKAIPQPDHRALLALAYSQLARGLLTDAAATYENMAAMGPAAASVAATGLADLAIYQGRFSEAIPMLEAAAAADLAAQNASRAAIKFTSIAYAHLMKGEKARAIAAAERALANSNTMPVRFLAARVFVEAGDIGKAQDLAASLTSELPATPQAHGRIIEGEIALKKGDAREAIKILTDANALLDTWLGRFALGRAYLEAGAFPQADSEFDRCIARRGEALSLMDEGATYGHFPAVYYYQGRVREGLGTAGFADSYREYLRIRGDSTEDPLVPDARRRVSN